MTIVLKKPVTAKRTFFIRLGGGGEWEQACISDGTLRLGYIETPEGPCLAGQWDQVKELWTQIRRNPRVGNQDGNQIRHFYETDESCLFITYANDMVYWCRPKGRVEVLEDKTRKRDTVDGWRCHSIKGVPLSFDRLSSDLLRTKRFIPTATRSNPHAPNRACRWIVSYLAPV